jgi:hypothetical protein
LRFPLLAVGLLTMIGASALPPMENPDHRVAAVLTIRVFATVLVLWAALSR